MEVDSKLPKEIAEKCEAFSEHVKKMEEQLEKISNISMKDRNALTQCHWVHWTGPKSI